MRQYKRRNLDDWAIEQRKWLKFATFDEMDSFKEYLNRKIEWAKEGLKEKGINPGRKNYLEHYQRVAEKLILYIEDLKSSDGSIADRFMQIAERELPTREFQKLYGIAVSEVE